MNKLSTQPCMIARSLAIVGDAWSMLIMRDAHAGLTRFDDFRRSLGIAPTMLTGRLSALVDEDCWRSAAIQTVRHGTNMC